MLHHARLGPPILGGVLYDAETIDPKVWDSKPPSHMHGVPEGLGKRVQLDSLQEVFSGLPQESLWHIAAPTMTQRHVSDILVRRQSNVRSLAESDLRAGDTAHRDEPARKSAHRSLTLSLVAIGAVLKPVDNLAPPCQILCAPRSRCREAGKL